MERLPSQRIKSDDAEIVYWILGDGLPVVLLHPFPVHHEFWLPVADVLATRYRVMMPDLRGHGESEVGEGPATMEKHAADIARVMDDANIGRAPLVGVSIGGYALFEFWRKYRGPRGRARTVQHESASRWPGSPRRTTPGGERRSRARHRTVFRVDDSEGAGEDDARDAS